MANVNEQLADGKWVKKTKRADGATGATDKTAHTNEQLTDGTWVIRIKIVS